MGGYGVFRERRREFRERRMKGRRRGMGVLSQKGLKKPLAMDGEPNHGLWGPPQTVRGELYFRVLLFFLAAAPQTRLRITWNPWWLLVELLMLLQAHGCYSIVLIPTPHKPIVIY